MLVMATLGFMFGLAGFLFGSAALIWAVGSARSTHRVQYAPLPDLPETLESAPREESEDLTLTKAEREVIKDKKRVITDFSELFPPLDD